MYLLMQQVSNLNHMYRYSLNSFLKLFLETLKEDRKGISGEDLIKHLSVRIFENSLKYICYGLSNDLKLSIVAHIIHGARPKLFDKNEWPLFMGEFICNKKASLSLPSWCPPHIRDDFNKLAGAIPDELNRANLEDPAWKSWFESANCENNFSTNTNLSEFQKVIFTKVFRRDRTSSALLKFIESCLVDKKILFPSLDIGGIMSKNSSPEVPILFIISPGSDPSESLESYCLKAV